MSDKRSKRILFVGMPDTAYLTLQAVHSAGFNIVGVVSPPENHPASFAFCSFAQKLGYTTITPKKSVKEQAFIKDVAKLNADLAVVTSYSQRFPKTLLNAVKDGFINVHPSLLPEYRGANPYSHVIINNEQVTGVTIHKMDETFDTGNILVQYPMEILQNDTMGMLFNKLNRLSCEILVDFLNQYVDSGMPDGIVQTNLSKPKNLAFKILPESEFTRIDWDKSAIELDAKIRGLNPFLPAGTSYKGIPVKIFSAEVDTKKVNYSPGMVCNLGETIDVSTGDGVLKIRTLQLGSFFIGNARDFRERVKISLGDSFS